MHDQFARCTLRRRGGGVSGHNTSHLHTPLACTPTFTCRDRGGIPGKHVLEACTKAMANLHKYTPRSRESFSSTLNTKVRRILRLRYENCSINSEPFHGRCENLVLPFSPSKQWLIIVPQFRLNQTHLQWT